MSKNNGTLFLWKAPEASKWLKLFFLSTDIKISFFALSCDLCCNLTIFTSWGSIASNRQKNSVDCDEGFWWVSSMPFRTGLINSFLCLFVFENIWFFFNLIVIIIPEKITMQLIWRKFIGTIAESSPSYHETRSPNSLCMGGLV